MSWNRPSIPRAQVAKLGRAAMLAYQCWVTALAAGTGRLSAPDEEIDSDDSGDVSGAEPPPGDERRLSQPRVEIGVDVSNMFVATLDRLGVGPPRSSAG